MNFTTNLIFLINSSCAPFILLVKYITSPQRTRPGAAMTQTTRPSHQAVRSWMQQRQVDRTPPPAPEQIRRELGWQMVEAGRDTTRGKR